MSDTQEHMSIDQALFREVVDISDLFVVKGKPGIWMLRSTKVHDGIVPLQAWFDKKTNITVREKNVMRLGAMIIWVVLEGKVPVEMPLQDAFHNLHEAKKSGVNVEYSTLSDGEITDLMEKVAPGFIDDFKKHHLRDIIKWYGWICETIDKELNSDDE